MYLGIQTLRKSATITSVQEAKIAEVRAGRIFGQGLIAQVLNPKVFIFFIALLPQFVRSADVHSPLPFLFIASFSAFYTAVLRRSSRFEAALKWATSLLYIGLGLNLLRVKAKLAS